MALEPAANSYCHSSNLSFRLSLIMPSSKVTQEHKEQVNPHAQNSRQQFTIILRLFFVTKETKRNMG